MQCLSHFILITNTKKPLGLTVLLNCNIKMLFITIYWLLVTKNKQKCKQNHWALIYSIHKKESKPHTPGVNSLNSIPKTSLPIPLKFNDRAAELFTWTHFHFVILSLLSQTALVSWWSRRWKLSVQSSDLAGVTAGAAELKTAGETDHYGMKYYIIRSKILYRWRRMTCDDQYAN